MTPIVFMLLAGLAVIFVFGYFVIRDGKRRKSQREGNRRTPL